MRSKDMINAKTKPQLIHKYLTINFLSISYVILEDSLEIMLGEIFSYEDEIIITSIV
jgi:hypothetical protein